MEVKNVDVYSKNIDYPVDIEKVKAICEDGWFPLAIYVPSEIGTYKKIVDAVFVKRSGGGKKDERIGNMEKKLDAITKLLLELRAAKPSVGKKKGK